MQAKPRSPVPKEPVDTKLRKQKVPSETIEPSNADSHGADDSKISGADNASQKPLEAGKMLLASEQKTQAPVKKRPARGTDRSVKAEGGPNRGRRRDGSQARPPGPGNNSTKGTSASRVQISDATMKIDVPARQPLRSAKSRRKKRRGLWSGLLLMVVVPTILSGLYFFAIASPQYRTETQFAVRGSNQTALSTLGLTALPGVSSQDGDSYVVQNYLRSTQIVRDILRDQKVDIRSFYSRDFIDPLYRIEPDMAYIDFERYWQFQTSAEFNSITGTTTFRAHAFTPNDARAIGDAVLKQSSKLVNELSSESRAQLIGTAQAEVKRTETRLREARVALQAFQNREQLLNPTAIATANLDLTSKLKGQLVELRTRRAALRSTVSRDSPSVRVIDRQIEAVTQQIAEQRRGVGSGNEDTSSDNLVANTGRFVELTLSVEFATEAYKSALASLETALTDARKQNRYLATFIHPEPSLKSDHPSPTLYTMLGFLVFFAFWVLCVFLLRTVRDHAL